MKTIFVKQKDVKRTWYLIDAQDKVLGKVAVKAASILRGKHKAEFTPHQEIGDYVIIINARKAKLAGNKRNDKLYYRHSGYMGGLRTENYEWMMESKPTYPMEHAVKGMLPKNRLGRKLFSNVKVYAGSDHPHAAQQPEVVEI